MMRPPAFWDYGMRSPVPALLWPLARLAAAYTAHRVSRPGWKAPVPVFCAGNATVGGAGKTTLVLDLCRRLRALGLEPHVLTRGYGGAADTCLRVDPARHDARQVGDEALLLASVAPTWVGADRARGAQAATRAGAQVLIMDDGLQNPGLARDCSFLVIDGASGFGNGRVLPAGPLREPPRAAAARAQACVLIGSDRTGALDLLPPALPILRASLVPDKEVAALRARRVLAFAGIGRPEKFFAMLEGHGVEVARRLPFPDHHPFREAELDALLAEAARIGASAVTTPKDHARVPAGRKQEFLAVGVSLAWETETALTSLLLEHLPFARHSRQTL